MTRVRTPSISLLRSVTVVTTRRGWRPPSSTMADPSKTNCVPGFWGSHLLSMCVGSSNWARSKSSALPVRGGVLVFSEPPSLLPLCVPQAAAESIISKEIKMTAMCTLRISDFLCSHLPHSLALREAEIQGGQDEQVQQRRGEQPTKDDYRHGMLYLMTGDAARYRQRHQRQSRCRGGHQDRRQPLLGPAQDELGPEVLALFSLQVLEVANHQDPVSSRDAEHGQKPYQRAQREDAAAQPHREHSSNQRHRQGEEEQQCQTQTPEGSLKQKQDGQGCGNPIEKEVLLGGGQLA